MALAPVAYTLWQQYPALTTRRIRSGQTATASSSRPATRPCCCTRCCIYRRYVRSIRSTRRLDELAVSLDDIKQFRQLDSKTARPSRIPLTSGVETTTGPLGQGVRQQRRHGDRRQVAGRATTTGPASSCSTYNVYALCSDGDMMEGVSSEAASLAGHLKLANLCWIYDNNHITIEGTTDLAFSEDVATRFEATAGMSRTSTTPTIWTCSAQRLSRLSRTQRSADADHRQQPHRLRLAAQAGHATPPTANRWAKKKSSWPKKFYGWPEDAKFFVPDGVYEHFRDGIGKRGKELRDQQWKKLFDEYAKTISRARRRSLTACSSRELPEGWDKDLPTFPPTRKAWPPASPRGKVLNAIAQEYSVADRRLGRPGAVDEDATYVRRRGRLPGGQLRRPQFAFRHPRARHGRPS